MQTPRRPLRILCLAAAVLTAALPAQEEVTGTLVPKVTPKWTYILPAETWSPVSGNIPVAHAGGAGFITEVQGAALAIDTNGDGRPDEKARGAAGSCVLKGKSPEGQAFSYAVRLKYNGTHWTWAAGGAMTGKLLGETVTVIDQDNNGQFDGYGTDAMIVGNGEAASYLSKVVNVDGALYAFEIAADGRTMSAKPFTGEAGTLNGLSGFEGKGRIESAVVTSENSEWSFNLAGAKSGLRVPAGSYRLSGGYITAGKETVRVRRGRMDPVPVSAGAAATLPWGGPVSVEFRHEIAGDKITVPYDLKFFGKSGEEYYEFFPDATSPIIKITDRKSGKPLAQGRFPGC